MPFPSTGWLSNNPRSEVLPAKLPEIFVGQYRIGIDSFISITDVKPSSVDIKFGDCVVTFDHGLSEDGTQYGLVANIIRKGAFGSIILDTLVIPEVALNQLTVEICIKVASYVKENCPETSIYTLEPTL